MLDNIKILKDAEIKFYSIIADTKCDIFALQTKILLVGSKDKKINLAKIKSSSDNKEAVVEDKEEGSNKEATAEEATKADAKDETNEATEDETNDTNETAKETNIFNEIAEALGIPEMDEQEIIKAFDIFIEYIKNNELKCLSSLDGNKEDIKAKVIEIFTKIKQKEISSEEELISVAESLFGKEMEELIVDIIDEFAEQYSNLEAGTANKNETNGDTNDVANEDTAAVSDIVADNKDDNVIILAAEEQPTEEEVVTEDKTEEVVTVDNNNDIVEDIIKNDLLNIANYINNNYYDCEHLNGINNDAEFAKLLANIDRIEFKSGKLNDLITTLHYELLHQMSAPNLLKKIKEAFDEAGIPFEIKKRDPDTLIRNMFPDTAPLPAKKEPFIPLTKEEEKHIVTLNKEDNNNIAKLNSYIKSNNWQQVNEIRKISVTSYMVTLLDINKTPMDLIVENGILNPRGLSFRLPLNNGTFMDPISINNEKSSKIIDAYLNHTSVDLEDVKALAVDLIEQNIRDRIYFNIKSSAKIEKISKEDFLIFNTNLLYAIRQYDSMKCNNVTQFRVTKFINANEFGLQSDSKVLEIKNNMTDSNIANDYLSYKNGNINIRKATIIA